MIKILDAKMNTLGGRAETVQEIFEGEFKILLRLENEWEDNEMGTLIKGEQRAILFAIQMLKAVLDDDRETIEKYAGITNRILSAK